ncbi:Nucleic-acid-binding protein from mobile element jockey [Trachymyrmex cornetzi]|uniref:Nucleic-acid-binding protein from mobile element jockey n=1 Tax=Trachymyrmex cornetzi TaxID=471704 RepID=A0A151JP91_9HYME|nr:Nucleic-acid-binding protein from mobile element jockey [Trachymyrmex cornetzi]
MVNKESVIKLERMYRRKWDEKSKKSINVKSDNIVIIMKGENLCREISIFDSRVKLRVRPYIQSVRQCYNCYKFGHIKQFCKSNTVCINCGREAHGLCEAESCCRNCGGTHRSTFRQCSVLEKNRSINTIMAYRNVSFHKARLILEGREDTGVDSGYDRYERPERWPSLPSRGVANEKAKRRNEVSRNYGKTESINRGYVSNVGPHVKTFAQTNNRVRVPNRKNNDKGCDINNYFSQFNDRSWDINREKRGMALRNNFQVEEQIPVDNENGNNNRYNMNTDTEEFFIERIVEKVMLALETETRVG